MSKRLRRNTIGTETSVNYESGCTSGAARLKASISFKVSAMRLMIGYGDISTLNLQKGTTCNKNSIQLKSTRSIGKNGTPYTYDITAFVEKDS